MQKTKTVILLEAFLVKLTNILLRFRKKKRRKERKKERKKQKDKQAVNST
jgi:hypothetical protein